jgi:hypothetical protein
LHELADLQWPRDERRAGQATSRSRSRSSRRASMKRSR